MTTVVVGLFTFAVGCVLGFTVGAVAGVKGERDRSRGK